MKVVHTIIVLAFLSACQTGQQSLVLSPAEFNSQIQEPRIQLLDVRTQEEYDAGHIATAQLMDVQSDQFEEATNTLYKDLPVYLYCKRGKRSADAASRLRKLGFKNVYELEGGYDAWLGNKLPFTVTVPKKVYESDTIPFEEAIKGNKLVLVDFNAVWCKPCKMLEPIIHKLHDERAEEVIVYSIDTDKRTDLSRQYQANAIPLIMLFKNNQVLHRSEGLLSESKLNELIDLYK